MTREEYAAKLEQLKAEVEKQVTAYNEAYGDKQFDKASEINAATEKNIAEHNSIAQMLCFYGILDTEDPMVTACLKLSFPVIAVKDTFEGEGEIKILKRVMVSDKEKQIDLLKLEKFAKDRGRENIGHDPLWNNMIERLNLLFAMDCAVEIGKGEEFIREMHDCFAIREASRDINFGVKDPKAGTPISNTALLKAVSATVSAMIGEESGKKALTHDVRFLKIASAKKSRKALTIQCANNKYMRGYLMEVCNRILTDGKYDVEYKRIKK